MPRGGAQPGAGRKAGAQHAETRKVIQQAADDGVLPLAVMIDNIRWYTTKAEKLAEQLIAGLPETDDPRGAVVGTIGEILQLRKLAGEEAARAAPYCHPRQGNLVDEVASDHMPLADRIAAYQRSADTALAENKVVDFPGK